MSDSSYFGDLPGASRGSSGGTNSFGDRYPTGVTPKLYTKIDFFEYKRDISRPNAERRQTGSIQLPTPEQYNDATGVRLSDSSLGILGAFSQFVAQGKGLPEITADASKTVRGALESSLINTVFNMASLMPGGFDSTTQDVARSFTGIVPNPHVTVLFDGVQLKSYDLSWKVSPRSQQDADTLNRIIRRIKGRSLPSILRVGGANYAFQYPDLVKVSIMYGSTVNKQLEASNFAFIESFSVGSSIGNSIAFFKDGQPVENTINMRIKEIDVRTRENYEGPSATGTLLATN